MESLFHMILLGLNLEQKNSKNIIFELNCVYLRGKYKSYITLRVYTGVSKGAAFIYSGLKSYKVFVT